MSELTQNLSSAGISSAGISIEDQYQELSEIEHVIHRPDTWLGSMVSTEIEIPILEDGKLVERKIEYIPGLLKLYDEIISNAIDEHKRTKNNKVKLDKISVTVKEDGTFICSDNGGIPVVKHAKAGIYVQEMLFGRLRAGSNFDDTKQRETVGKNGFGACLVNIMSKQFSVITSDGSNKGSVAWSNNMHEKTDIKIEKSKERGTTVTALIDIAKFNLTSLPYGIVKMIERRCILGAAANTGLAIEFNDNTYKFDTFKQYVEMHGTTVIGEKNEDWEYYIGFVSNVDEGGKIYGIVNGAECSKGTHAHHMETIVHRHVSDIMKKKYDIDDVTKKLIAQHTVLFINITVPNPTYDSQAKTVLTNDLGYAFYDTENDKKRWPKMSRKMILALQDSLLVEYVHGYYQKIQEAKENDELKRKAKASKDRKISAIDKLIDANASGKKARSECELWIFEGQSAGAAFRNVRTANKQAAYFLKGKVMNTIGMKSLAIMNNQELSDIIRCSGLNPLDPSDLSSLRFGKWVICTDEDPDGSSITGQLITFFATHFPELLKQGHIYNSRSPLIKATKKKEAKYFYSMSDYENFTKDNKGWSHKYFKGLGSLSQDDYAAMVQQPILERFVYTDEDFKIIKAWMGSDSEKRKEFLRA
jgi:DNA topoisomerase-2